MSASLALTLAAAAVGVVAGLWFCVGSAFTSAATIAELAKSYWDYHETHAQVVVEQSAQYSVGAPLLVVSFALQVDASLVPTERALPLPIASPSAFLLVVAIAVWLVSFGAYKLLLRSKGRRVHAILEQQMHQQNGA